MENRQNIHQMILDIHSYTYYNHHLNQPLYSWREVAYIYHLPVNNALLHSLCIPCLMYRLDSLFDNYSMYHWIHNTHPDM